MYGSSKKYYITSAGITKWDILKQYSWRYLLMFVDNLDQDSEQIKICNSFLPRNISM